MAEPESKNCQNCKQDFVIEPDDFIFYEKIAVPLPTWCWRCRAMRRMAFRNMRHIYMRTCDATGVKIFTLVPPDSLMPVYSNEYWASDKWNSLDYGRDYDFSRPFFEQIRGLHNEVPWGIMWSFEMVNCNYSVSAFSKNCYLCFDSGYDEDSSYNVTLLYSKHCLDGLNVKDSQLCYYCINTNKSYKTFFSKNCTSCVDTWFSQDCVGCSNCFGCVGLRNKNYYIFNKPHDKKSYEAKLAEMKLDSWKGIQSARSSSERVWCEYPVKYQHSVQAQDCIGDYIYNSTEIHNSFFIGTAQNLRHCQSVIYPPNKDGMDITSSEGTELAYETIACGRGSQKTLGCVESGTINDSYYSINCRNVSNVFGCVALKNKSYCILNKQYTKKEYFELLPKIKQHMNEMPYIDAKGRTYGFGEFFPPELSPVGYSQSQAFEYFPLTEEKGRAEGYRWRVPDKRTYQPTKKSSELPDRIGEVTDVILKDIIQCGHDESGGHSFGCDVDCASAFRITKEELVFYRKMNLPLPRLCFNCRHIDRIKWRNVPALYDRQCMCDYKVYKNGTVHQHHTKGACLNTFQTSYAPERPEIVYCEQCYNSEVA